MNIKGCVDTTFGEQIKRWKNYYSKPKGGKYATKLTVPTHKKIVPLAVVATKIFFAYALANNPKINFIQDVLS